MNKSAGFELLIINCLVFPWHNSTEWSDCRIRRLWRDRKDLRSLARFCCDTNPRGEGTNRGDRTSWRSHFHYLQSGSWGMRDNFNKTSFLSSFCERFNSWRGNKDTGSVFHSECQLKWLRAQHMTISTAVGQQTVSLSHSFRDPETSAQIDLWRCVYGACMFSLWEHAILPEFPPGALVLYHIPKMHRLMG